ncbi:MAG: sarcosine oxidase subunit delta [Candidatus Limnocylindrales bacterium]
MPELDCPNCGRRPIEEFTFGGERPTVPDRISDLLARDVDYAWMHDNVNGATSERWFHAAGCRRWLTVHRNTSQSGIALAD